ncbi:MAG: hypothetical protein M3Y28_04350, partial [Armatimonadota bacterium]|nr:hypothetical protein [Armatimonadota bacterium]
TSWWFRIVEPGPPAPYLSPAGLVYGLMTPLHQGRVLFTTVQGPDFAASSRFAAAPLLSAVAVQQGRHLAVNLVNFSPDRDARLTLALRGFTPRGIVHLQMLTGPGPDATNEPDAPTRVHVTQKALSVTQSPLLLTLPANCAATVELTN